MLISEAMMDTSQSDKTDLTKRKTAFITGTLETFCYSGVRRCPLSWFFEEMANTLESKKEVRDLKISKKR